MIERGGLESIEAQASRDVGRKFKFLQLKSPKHHVQVTCGYAGHKPDVHKKHKQ